MLDAMATRYHLLPSQVMSNASTFDLFIMDAAISWHNYQQQVRENGGKAPAPQLTQEQMQKMIERTKNVT